jgi:hypothetical protein
MARSLHGNVSRSGRAVNMLGLGREGDGAARAVPILDAAWVP